MERAMWVDEREVSKIMGVAIQTLRNWRFKQIGPVYSKVGRAVRYRVDDVIRFMEERRVSNEN